MVELEDTGLTFATEVDLERLQALAAEWLQVIGEDPGREGLLKTPERVANEVPLGWWLDWQAGAPGASAPARSR